MGNWKAAVWVIALVGGCTGSTGATGDEGPFGEQGPEGPSGEQGIEGPEGVAGPRGETGPVGATGPAGPEGDEGQGTQGDPGAQGPAGPAAGETPGLAVTMTVVDPPNGTHFVVGDRIILEIVLEDGAGNPISIDSLSNSRLMVAGPQDPLETKTALELLDATADRSASPHHYVSLADTTSSNLSVDGNVLTYTLEPITDEAAGTYTAGFWAVSAAYPQDQTFEVVDLQIGTEVAESKIVAGGCDSCHLGAANRQYYLHHVDPGSSVYGYPSIDSAPIDSCKLCHNQDGYAAVRKCDDGSKPVRNDAGEDICDDGSQNWTYFSDSIVRRVHGVHQGKQLLSEFNTNAEWGDFLDYVNVTFPSDVRNCTKCHNDDAWKMEPSRLACGSCHDQVDWTSGAFTPPRSLGEPSGGACTVTADCTTEFGKGVCNLASGECELTSHAGGPQTTDTSCTACHGADTGLSPISVAHEIPATVFPFTIEMSLVDPPANGTHYVAGEAPVVEIVIKESGTGTPIDHTTVATWDRAYLFINGPRAKRIPAFTSAARAEVVSAPEPFDLTGTVALQVAVGDLSLALDPADGSFGDIGAATADEVIAWLNADAAFAAGALAEARGNAVLIHALPSQAQQPIEVLASDVATSLGLVVGRYTATAASSSYAANDLKTDPKVTLTTGAVFYELDDVGTAAPGTYSIWVRARQVSDEPYGMALANFQVGTGVVETKVATNCFDCHTGGFHSDYPFDPDVCGSCHDYRRGADPRMEGDLPDGFGASAASGRTNAGFGAAPLSRRIHGVHFGNYVNFPLDIHASWGEHFSHIIFPQDVRNCEKCHAEADSWQHRPNRLACLGCHDSEDARAHARQMTFDPTPVDEWNGDEEESCAVCHATGRDFAVDEKHDVTNPYVPPYPREGWVTGPHPHPASSE